MTVASGVLTISDVQDGYTPVKGVDYSDGAGFYRYGVDSFDGTWPATATANTYFEATAGRAPVVEDVLTIYDSLAGAASSTRSYDGSSWVAPAFVVDGDMIATGTITADKLNVQELSAVSANIGTFQSATTGARLVITDDKLEVYDENNVLRVVLGNLL